MYLVLLILSVFADEDCTLLKDSPEKPSPSLVKCYRHNTNACCVSAHDAHIQGVYESFFSAQCQREYNNMEDYFCFACNPTQGEFVDEVTKTVYVCEEFAKRVWGSSLDGRTEDYDNCGMYTYWLESSETILPSSYFATAYEFFAVVKPPYFTDYTIDITRNKDCFNVARVIGTAVLALLLVLS